MYRALFVLKPKTWHRPSPLRAFPSVAYGLGWSTSIHTAPGTPNRTSQPPGLGQPIRLRDYQEECIQSVLSSLGKGHKRLGISLATGSGKTVIFTQLIDRIKPRSKDATQTLILAHRRELVEQAARHCANAYPDKTIEVEMGKLQASGTADITLASLQSLVSRDRYLKLDRDRFKLVLVDEAHHIVAPGYLKILRHLGLSTKRADSPHLVGVSATFSRFDGLRLGAAIDEIVYHKDYIDMIGGKWLSDVVFTTVESTVDLSRCRSRADGDFELASLSRAVNTDQANDIVIRSWLAKAKGRKSTLVFCVDLNHVTALAQRFRYYGVDARFVTGDTPVVERTERLDAFRNGEFPVLINCNVFTEGTDIPNIDCVLLARPTRSRNLLVQMIGRGMRLYPGKENCHILDMVSSLETGIVTTPTLFGLDPGEIVNDASVDGMQSLRDLKDAERQREQQVSEAFSTPVSVSGAQKVSFTEYDSIFDLIADTSGEKHIRAISQYAWVQVAPEKYILSSPSGTFLRLSRAEDEAPGLAVFKAWEIRALPKGVSKSPYAAPRELLTAATFADAVHGCDKYVEESDNFPHSFVSRRMAWRRQPPTDGQLEFINKIRNPEDRLGAGDITKGMAMDMITKLKHGARGRFADYEAGRRRRDRAVHAQEQLLNRQLQAVVAVGPVPT
ncbi:P-loop containing nucleoside triphosphate hydrolase protein [Thozetella sp. PMI_491]|nr:P-loop containing nucleoside triphosphate hydrolase protein [Thozetella sp. PMI_491]